MTHIRAQVRDQIVTELTGLSTTASRVFASRVYPMQSAELPGLTVYATQEVMDFEEDGIFSAPARNLSLIVTGYSDGDLDDELDQIAAEVEVAMVTDITHNSLAENTLLQSTAIDFSGEGEKPIGTIALEYQITYRTPFADPETVG